MTEATYRAGIGFFIISFLYLHSEIGDKLLYGLIFIMFVEGISGIHISTVISKIRYGRSFKPPTDDENKNAFINFPALRALRIVVPIFISVSYGLFRPELWFFSWFMGFMLFASGITHLCPVAMILRRLGFR